MLANRASTDTTALRYAYSLRFADSLATTTMAFVVPLMIFNLTHNIAWSGISFALEWLPRLLAIPAAGPMVDYLRTVRFFMFANSIRLALVGGAALWLWHSPGSWLVLLLVAVCAGMLAESTFVAAEKLGVEITADQPSHRIQAVQVGIDQVVQVIGPIIGGVLLAINGAIAFVGVGTLLVVSIFIMWRLEKIAPKTVIHNTLRPNILGGFKTGLKVIGQHRSLVHVIAGTMLFNLLLALLLTITPAMVEQRFGRNVGSVSLLWALAAGASVVAVGLASQAARRFGITKIGFVSGIIACGACLIACLTTNYWVYVECMMVFLAMDASYAVFIRTARARIVPQEVYGTTVGVIVLLALVPYPIAGGLVAAVPFKNISILLIACTALTAVLSCLSFARMDHRTINAGA